MDESETCWEIRKCPPQKREKCIVYIKDRGYDCWLFINDPGIGCFGEDDPCGECPVFLKRHPELKVEE